MNPNYNNLLWYAVNIGNITIVKYLLPKVDIYSPPPLSEKYANSSILNLAIHRNNYELVKLIVEFGFDVNFKSSNTIYVHSPKKPLYLANNLMNDNGIVNYLQSKGATA